MAIHAGSSTDFINFSRKNIKNTISDYVYVYDSEGNPIVIDGVKFVVRKGKKLDKELLHSYLKHLFNNSVLKRMEGYYNRPAATFQHIGKL